MVCHVQFISFHAARRISQLAIPVAISAQALLRLPNASKPSRPPPQTNAQGPCADSATGHRAEAASGLPRGVNRFQAE